LLLTPDISSSDDSSSEETTQVEQTVDANDDDAINTDMDLDIDINEGSDDAHPVRPSSEISNNRIYIG
jgi:hypothetical protein